MAVRWYRIVPAMLTTERVRAGRSEMPADVGRAGEQSRVGLEQGIVHAGRGKEMPLHAHQPGKHQPEPERRHRVARE